ncbi:uncharacterized protein LOC128605714 isoform X3 [Ictalurus furcatus]|uniref:uncharacterized protein LOC128605714 isoform X3 n=1 Tax=Ictalurus furcatus TaxID=66913 RepID=UPI00234FE4BA|nr:uncharacterized protein LOC128605714 isoform X3 [Ictalurus furcatus]
MPFLFATARNNLRRLGLWFCEEDGGNQSSEGSERDRWRGELCNGGRLLPVPAGVTRRSEEERETERGRGRESMRNRERESERERATAKASQSLEPQADGRLSSWRGASRAQTGGVRANHSGQRVVSSEVNTSSSARPHLRHMDSPTCGWSLQSPGLSLCINRMSVPTFQLPGIYIALTDQTSPLPEKN